MLNQKELIYSIKWDILIVLDSCRCDYFESIVLPKIRELPLKSIDFQCVKSQGSCSVIWFTRTFTKPLKDVIYLSNNPLINRNSPLVRVNGKTLRPIDIFHDVVEVFRLTWKKIHYTYHFDPEELTKIAKLYLKSSDKRLIVHYMQPHAPYPFSAKLAKYFLPDFVKGDANFWSMAKKGEIKLEDIKEAYIQNLEWVSRYVTELIKDVKDKVVIVTSDHGEDFGELKIFNHPCWEGIEKQYGEVIEMIKIVPFLILKT